MPVLFLISGVQLNYKNNLLAGMYSEMCDWLRDQKIVYMLCISMIIIVYSFQYSCLQGCWGHPPGEVGYEWQLLKFLSLAWPFNMVFTSVSVLANQVCQANLHGAATCEPTEWPVLWVHTLWDYHLQWRPPLFKGSYSRPRAGRKQYVALLSLLLIVCPFSEIFYTWTCLGMYSWLLQALVVFLNPGGASVVPILITY